MLAQGYTFLFNLDAQLLFDTVLLAVAVFFLFMLMSYLLFNPARKLLKDRQDRIESDINTAVADKESAAALKAEYEGKLKDIDKEAEAILTEARQKALKNQNKIVDDAKEEASRIIKRAREEAELEKKHAMDDMKQEMIQIASLMAQKAVAASITTDIQDTLVEDNRLSSLSDEVTAVKEIIAANDDLSKLMDHPQIDKEEKVRIIEEIFGGRVSAELVGLIRMIIEKNHYKELTLVFDYFLDRVKEYQNIGTAYVTSAFELSKEQKLAVEKRLLDTTKYVKFEMHFEVDTALIGGMKIRIGDRVVDSSVSSRLERLTRDLTKIQLKVGECAP